MIEKSNSENNLMVADVISAVEKLTESSGNGPTVDELVATLDVSYDVRTAVSLACQNDLLHQDVDGRLSCRGPGEIGKLYSSGRI